MVGPGKPCKICSARFTSRQTRHEGRGSIILSISKLLLPGRIAQLTPTKAVQQSALHEKDAIRASIDRAWETALAASTEGYSAFVILYLKRLCVCCRCRQTTKASARCVLVVVVVVVLAAVELLQTTTSKRPTYLLGEFWPDAEERQCAADCQRGLDWGWSGGLKLPCGPTRRRERLDTNPASQPSS